MPSWQSSPFTPLHPTRVLSVLTVTALLCLLAFASAASAGTASTVLDVLSSEPRFSSLIRALQATDLDSYLKRRTTDGVTVFAPTNQAFENRTGSWHNVDRDILEYHILPFTIPVRELTDGRLLKTLLAGPRGGDKAGQRVKITADSEGRIFVGGSHIVEGDMTADNGIIHVVDSLLDIPVDLVKTLASIEDASTLSNSLKISGLLDILSSKSPLTLFAPLDRAFDQISAVTRQYLFSKHAKSDLSDILKYHLHEGAYYIAEIPVGKTELPALAEGSHELRKPKKDGEVTYDDAVIEKADIIASNGAVHLIPRVFLPSSFKMNAIKYLIGMDRTKFADFFVSSGLSDYLTDRSPSSPVTIFTVPNEALDGLPTPSMNQMLYHVVPGLYEPEQLNDNDLLRTALKTKGLHGDHQVVQVMVLDNNGEREVLINDAKVLGNPVVVDGAVIYTLSHMIELPVDPLQAIVTDLGLSTFAAAVHTADLDTTIRKRQRTTIFVPSNQAFMKESALMAYLLLPENEKELRTVLGYHIATKVVYSIDLPKPGKEQDLSIATLIGQNITVIDSKNGNYLALLGSQPAEARFQTSAPRNRPTSNGNLFVIDRVLLPDVDITIQSLLKALRSPTFVQLLSEYLSGDSEVPPLDSSDDEPFTLLVPNEKAFALVDMEDVVHDPARLTCSMKMHFVRGRAELVDGDVWETMCADGWVKVHSIGDEKWELEMSDSSGNGISSGDAGRARILRRGEVRNGNLYEIDRFFSIPVSHGLAWYWILVIVLSALGLAGTAFALWRYMQVRKRRSGYQEVPGRD